MSDCTRVVWRDLGNTVTNVPVHCGHPAGSEASRTRFLVVHGDRPKGVDMAICCYCGEAVQVPWSIVDQELDGHGPMVLEPQKIWHWPLGWE